MSSVALIGLGNMGLAFGERLLANGYDVSGVDIRPEPLNALTEAGGRGVESIVDLPTDADVAIISLASPNALRDVATALASSLDPSAIVVESSTFSTDDKRAARDQLASAGLEMLDASVSGTPESVAANELAVYLSGSEATCERIRDVILGFGRSARYVGEFGRASELKLICNLLVAINNVATAEAMSLASQAGFDRGLVHEVVSESVGGSRIWDLRGEMMVTGEYRPGAQSYRVAGKDAALITEMSRRANAIVPMFELAIQMHRAGAGLGLADLDTSSLLELYSRLSGGEVE